MIEDNMTVESNDAEKVVKSFGAGQLLRAAREAQGMHIAMLAVSLKVPVKKLEALEADRYDLLPDMVFVRALAASVCRTLKMDATPVLAALPRSQQPQIKTGEFGLNATFEEAPGSVGAAWLDQLRKPVSITVLVVVVGILVIAFSPDEWLGLHVSAARFDEKPQAVSLNTVPVEVTDTSVVPALTASAMVEQVPLTPSLSAAASTASVPQPQIPQSPAVSHVGAEQPIDNVPTGASGNDLLTLRAMGTSWVEVVDAKGVSQLRRTLNKDEMVAVAGTLPMSVVLGRADLVSVVVRGKSLDVAALAKDNVARFEVK